MDFSYNTIHRRLYQKVKDRNYELFTDGVVLLLVEDIVENITKQVMQGKVSQDNVYISTPPSQIINFLKNYEPFVEVVIEATAIDAADYIKQHGFTTTQDPMIFSSLDIQTNAEHLYKLKANDLISDVFEDVHVEALKIIKEMTDK